MADPETGGVYLPAPARHIRLVLLYGTVLTGIGHSDWWLVNNRMAKALRCVRSADRNAVTAASARQPRPKPRRR